MKRANHLPQMQTTSDESYELLSSPSKDKVKRMASSNALVQEEARSLHMKTKSLIGAVETYDV